MTPSRVGILGGTFDPIHCGHIDVATAAERALSLTRMYVMTANTPPHRRQPVASPFQRYAMVVLAVAKRPGWRASDLELRSDAPSYTSDTLARFHERGYRRTDLFFVVGADAFADIATWHDYPGILDAAHFAVVSRPGAPVDALPDQLPDLASRMTRVQVQEGGSRELRDPPDPGDPPDPTLIFLIDALTADVSATAIRRTCEAGQAIDGLVPPIVQQYIEQHGLYTSRQPGRRASDAPPPPAAGRLHAQD
jgi:nicotinate-nucleotide adenylyltransferase